MLGEDVLEGLKGVVTSALEMAYEHPWATAAAGITTLLAGAGTGAYLWYRTAKVNHQPQLIAAIKANDSTLANHYLSLMTPEELNKPDPTKTTPLYYALQLDKPQIAKALIDKFLQTKTAVNVTMPDGKSIFTNKLAKKLLSLVTRPYREYACSDAGRFPGHINPALDATKKAAILNRESKDVQAEGLASMIAPLQGQYSRQQITQGAKAIDKAQSAACTTFALAIADKLLTLFPHERIQIIAHQGGYRGTHIFLVVNQSGDDWEINQLQALLKTDTTTKDEKDNKVGQIIKQFEHAYFVDGWLASLGWDYGVFTLEQINNMPQNSHFITDGKCYFDSRSAVAARPMLS